MKKALKEIFCWVMALAFALVLIVGIIGFEQIIAWWVAPLKVMMVAIGSMGCCVFFQLTEFCSKRA